MRDNSPRRRRRLPAAGAVWLALAAGVAGAPASDDLRPWTADDGMLTVFQAAQEVQRSGLGEMTMRQTVDQMLSAFLASVDPYSRYLPPEDFAALLDAQRPGYAGTGMELIAEPGGAHRCVPHPDGPAWRAGVREGDRLVAVDGRPIAGRTMELIGAWVRGPRGTRVELELETPAGTRRRLKVEREWVQAESVRADTIDGRAYLRIYYFGSRTVEELRAAVENLPAAGPVRIDLRSNPGGSLFDAVDCARLFLPAGKTIVTVETRAGRKTYPSEEDGPFAGRRVDILQDRGTASAAEVFLAALLQNDRALSAGARTYGKGVTQKVAPLMNGAGLILTDGRLITPDGTAYDGAGIEPSVAVDPLRPADAFKVIGGKAASLSMARRDPPASRASTNGAAAQPAPASTNGASGVSAPPSEKLGANP